MDKKNINDLLDNFNFVVPEIQREYVWGATKNKRVLSQFIKDLDHKLGQGDVNVGFLYSYESGAEHYLIDGQQRYTTILLLCYYLSALEEDNSHLQFVSRLKLDQNVQAFSYRVRSNTESFLKNLFNSGVVDYKCISDQTWYKSEYENDITIISMIGALEVFGNMLKECKHITLSSILNHVFFWYFDVDMTSQGEELYITMNSRGEKLSDNEQLKPRLFVKLQDTREKEKYGKLWDEWEEFFYSHRNKSGNKVRDIKSVDDAMNNVLRIVLELKTKKEHNEVGAGKNEESIDLADLEKYMKAIKYYSNLGKKEFSIEIDRLYGDSKYDQNFFVLKSLLTERIKGQDEMLEFERVFHTISNQVRRNKIKSHKDYLSFLDNYRTSARRFYDFAIEDANIINGHELEKVRICNQQGEATERALWSVQETAFWNGNIKPLLSWALKDGLFELSEFQRIHGKFVKFFKECSDKDCTEDIVIRALLCLDLTDYPLSGTKFGYTREEWMNVFITNNEKIKEFFLGIGESEYMEVYCEKYISMHDSKKNWAEFVEEPELLEYLNTKHVYPHEKFGLLLVKNNWAKPLPVKVMHIFLILKKECGDILSTETESNKWNLWYYTNWEHPCAVIDNKLFAIDILYIQETHGGKYRMELFKREDKADTEHELEAIATKSGFEYNLEKGRYFKEISFDDQQLLQDIKFIYENRGLA